MHTFRKLLGNKAGFTLIELIIATAILGILAELFATVLINQMPRYRLNSATRQLAWDLMSARMKAITEYNDLKIMFPNNRAYTIWSDNNNDNVVDAGEAVAISSNFLDKYQDVSFALPLPTPFVFTIRGTSSQAQNVTLKNAEESRVISVSVAGKVSVN